MTECSKARPGRIQDSVGEAWEPWGQAGPGAGHRRPGPTERPRIAQHFWAPASSPISPALQGVPTEGGPSREIGDRWGQC